MPESLAFYAHFVCGTLLAQRTRMRATLVGASLVGFIALYACTPEDSLEVTAGGPDASFGGKRSAPSAAGGAGSGFGGKRSDSFASGGEPLIECGSGGESSEPRAPSAGGMRSAGPMAEGGVGGESFEPPPAAAGGMSSGGPVVEGGVGGVGGESFEPPAPAAGGKTFTWEGGAGEQGGTSPVTCADAGGAPSGGTTSGDVPFPLESITLLKSWDAELWFDKPSVDGPSDARFVLQQIERTGSAENALVSCSGFQYFSQTLSWPTGASNVAVDIRIPCDPSIQLQNFHLRGLDTDIDGEIDVIEGSGDAVEVLPLRYPASPPATGPVMKVELRARPDNTPPTLNVPRDVHPLNYLAIIASEPLQPDGHLSLSKGALSYSMTVQANPSQFRGLLNEFSLETILPFGDTWSVQASGKDVAGLPLNGPFQALTTLGDPGIFPQDGFESGGSNPPILLSGKARVVQGEQGAPPIRGKWSLVIEAGGQATLHLVRQPCQRYLRWTSGLIRGAYSLGSNITAGVIGGTKRARTYIDPRQQVGKLQEQQLLLEDAGADVVVRFANDPWSRCYLPIECASTPVVMIDDVRLE